MKAGALDEFLGGADPWLIAKAMTINVTVATHEQLNLAARRKFLIPNVCQHFGVRFVDTFELLNALEARFVLGVEIDPNLTASMETSRHSQTVPIGQMRALACSTIRLYSAMRTRASSSAAFSGEEVSACLLIRGHADGDTL